MIEQLEFDLCSPWLADATPQQVEQTRRRCGLPAPASIEEENQLRGLAVRLSYLDLASDDGRSSINRELEELRTMIGGRQWCLDQYFWRSTARRDPRGVRKVILALKNRFNL